MTNGTRMISNTLKTYRPEDKINLEYLLDLLRFHPTKNIDVDRIEYLSVNLRKPYNKKALFYKYKNEKFMNDVSYVMCVKNLFEKFNYDKHKYKSDIKDALRTEVHFGMKKKFYLDNTIYDRGVCDICKRDTSNIEVDHCTKPYVRILDEFLKKENIDILSIDVFQERDNTWLLQDRMLAKRWVKFHDEEAKFRMLCRWCNSRMGSSGYIPV